MPNRQIFVNLAVRDLDASKAFFAKLSFELNPQFTDEKAACMIINGEAYVMLLREPFFQSFTKRKICDASTHTESLFALSCESREKGSKKPWRPAANPPWTPWIRVSCTAGASTISMATTGRPCGWTPRP